MREVLLIKLFSYIPTLFMTIRNLGVLGIKKLMVKRLERLEMCHLISVLGSHSGCIEWPMNPMDVASVKNY